MLFDNIPKGVSKLEENLKKLPFVERVELLSGNGRNKNSVSYSKTYQSYVVNCGLGKKSYKFAVVVNGIKANPKYEKELKKLIRL